MSNSPQPYFPFEEKFLVGVAVLDDQHKEIVKRVNELHGLVIDKKSWDSQLEILTCLLNLTKTHFATEEQVLRVHKYPEYSRHRAAHEGLERTLKEYWGRIVKKERVMTLEYVELMKLWLVEHFAEFDHAYVSFLDAKNHPVENPADRVHSP
jgi:hemerythrin